MPRCWANGIRFEPRIARTLTPSKSSTPRLPHSSRSQERLLRTDPERIESLSPGLAPRAYPGFRPHHDPTL